MTDARQALGELGERVAAAWLRRDGWLILGRRFRNGHRDLDLIVERDGMVAFVEVKARRDARFIDPANAVGWRKRRELTRSAQVWIDRHGSPRQSYRFDVVVVVVEGERIRVRHLADAFPMHDAG